MKLSDDCLILNENLSLFPYMWLKAGDNAMLNLSLFPHLWLKAGDNAMLLLTGGLMKLNDASVSPQVVCGCIGV